MGLDGQFTHGVSDSAWKGGGVYLAVFTQKDQENRNFEISDHVDDRKRL